MAEGQVWEWRDDRFGGDPSEVIDLYLCYGDEFESLYSGIPRTG